MNVEIAPVVERRLGALPASADRIGRALDAVAPELEAIVGTVGAGAIAEFGIDVSRLHWDMTSMSLHGAYEDQEDGFPQVKYGHPKDRRTDLKQIQAGIAIAADGGIPVFHRAYDGGAGEVSQVVGAMTALRELAAPRDFLMIGDSKLISYPNLLAMEDAGVRFIAPAPAAKVPDGLYAALDPGKARLVDYTAARDAGKAPGQRGRYRVLEDTQSLTGPRKRDPQVTVRRILVHSSANAAAQQAARTRRLERAREELDKLQSACGGRYYATAQKVTARIGVITSKRRIGSCLVTSISTDEAGRPTLTWHFDQEVLAAEAAADGWYALLTTLDAVEADAAEVLIRYKGQPVIERRYSDFKGPLAVAPVFLHHNRRIAALITVICLALLVFCLIERQVRQALGDNQTMRGLYPDNRAVRPTGRMILYHLAGLRMRAGTTTDPPTILITRGVQAHLLELLGIDETRPRWLDTSNPTCEIRV
jgi:transposase